MIKASVTVMSLGVPLFAVVFAAGGGVAKSSSGWRNVDGPEGRRWVVDAIGGVLKMGGWFGGVHRCFGIMGLPPPAGTLGGTLTRMPLAVLKGCWGVANAFFGGLAGVGMASAGWRPIGCLHLGKHALKWISGTTSRLSAGQ